MRGAECIQLPSSWKICPNFEDRSLEENNWTSGWFLDKWLTAVISPKIILLCRNFSQLYLLTIHGLENWNTQIKLRPSYDALNTFLKREHLWPSTLSEKDWPSLGGALGVISDKFLYLMALIVDSFKKNGSLPRFFSMGNELRDSLK